MQKTIKVIKNRYEVKREFLKCRFSTIYQGFDREQQKPVLIRSLNEILPFNTPKELKDANSQIMIEGNILKTLSHDGLPKVLDVFKENEQPYIIFEDFDGMTLDYAILNNELKRTEKSFQWIISRHIEVINYLHNQNPAIISGGIYPQSILITSDGQIKLMEFGFMTMGLGAPGRTNFRMMGPPRYCSPQQLQGLPPSPADDIYSLGTLAYFTCTGKEPERAMDRLMEDHQKNILELNPLLSPDFASKITKAMEPDRAKRYGLIDDLREGFAGIYFQEKPLEKPGEEVPAEEIPPEEVPPKEAAKESVKEKIPRRIEDLSSMKINLVELFEKVIPSSRKEVVRATPPSSRAGSTFLTRYSYVDLKKIKIDPVVAKMMPERISRAIGGVVMEKNDFDEITVAVKDPSLTMIYDHISYISKGQLKPLLFRADPDIIDLAMEYIYERPPGVEQMGWYEFLEKKRYSGVDLEVKQDESQIEMFDREAIEGPVIEATNQIIKEAISIGASDIHLETYEKKLILRYRIDGVLHTMNEFENEIGHTIIKRLKILAKANIAQERDTQGGRISVKIADSEYDLRVSIIPVPHGENIVMRILNKGAFNYSLQDLGFTEESLERFNGLLTRPYGMILVSGPTGSGKTTTLYASLKDISRPDRKLLTVEDPIEYEMPGISQVQVSLAPREVEKKVTFAKVLREFLRQDPDVILVGEIRDEITARISVQAALTGHLLLSTIHTNDAVGIVTRLKDMGIAPYLVGSVLVGGLAQRLVRKICPACKREVALSPADAEIFKKNGVPITTLYKGKGCDNCHGYGYRGRIGIYEILRVSQEIGDLISTGANAIEIKKLAVDQGMKLIFHDALIKAANGTITMSEVNRVTIA
ncbi:MAG: Flp pilus assembly complex ATPase component TadA [Candidatus Eremiobacteraeota bacterium]|nr:Flp pilus assembly complex ATPase component TadA [Candidatus Eremiobacteraeota bacterium]